jgi:hypothetical protein
MSDAVESDAEDAKKATTSVAEKLRVGSVLGSVGGRLEKRIFVK